MRYTIFKVRSLSEYITIVAGKFLARQALFLCPSGVPIEKETAKIVFITCEKDNFGSVESLRYTFKAFKPSFGINPTVRRIESINPFLCPMEVF